MTGLAVAEVFGPTWQGEGPSAGRLASFLRLGGCNLACSWCDTPWTWDATRYDLRAEIENLSVRDVLARIPTAGMLVITGGEPLLQGRAVAELLDVMGEREVEIETNGTLPPPLWARGVTFNVSPKLSNSGHATPLHAGWRGVPDARFKFVVRNEADLAEVAAYRTPPSDTWIMPEGESAQAVLDTARLVHRGTASAGWNLTLRQQVLLWGAERGR